jgi:hypothetical protein
VEADLAMKDRALARMQEPAAKASRENKLINFI